MRKRRKLHSKYIFLFLILILLIGTAYSYLSTTLNIKGTIYGESTGYIVDSNSNKNLKMEVLSINNWTSNGQNYYQYSINVTNVGADTITNFKLYLNFNNIVEGVNIWDYDYQLNSNQLVIISNKKIKSNETKQVQFIVYSSSTLKINKIKFEVVDNLGEITDYDLKFDITNSWGQYYYQYSVTLTNKQNKK